MSTVRAKCVRRGARLLLLATAVFPAAASAHAFLARAEPAVGSTVAVPPARVAIVFTEAVEPDFSTIAVTAPDGHRVDAGPPRRDGAADRLAVPLEPLAPGAYTVAWRAVSVDTHRTQGRFGFTLAPPLSHLPRR